jgi:hypothetical protein
VAVPSAARAQAARPEDAQAGAAPEPAGAVAPAESAPPAAETAPGAASGALSPPPPPPGGALTVPPPPPPAPEQAPGAGSAAAEGAAAPAAGAAATPPAGEAEHLPYVGMMLDFGLPDILALSLVGRPIPWVRLNFGFNYTYLFWGLKGGVGVVPFVHWVTPSLNLEYGKVFRSNISSKVSVPSDAKSIFDGFSYDYYSAELGLELGSGSGGCFFLRGGLAHVTIQSGPASLSSGGGAGSTPSTTTLAPTKVTADGPVFKIGFIKYF